jgi:hypothetical protein
MAIPQFSTAEFSMDCNRDVFRALRAMPRLTVAVVVLLVLQTALEFAAADVIPESSPLGFHIFSVVYYVLFTPFFIAVHRFVILGEVTRGYRLDWRGRRFQLFFGWAFAVFLITRLPFWLFSLSTYWLVQLLTWLSLVVAIVVIVRSMILFPAIAVDAPGATLRHAFEDTRGRHGWLILQQFVVAFIPSMLFVMAITLIGLGLPPRAASVLNAVALGLLMFFWMALAVVVASRLYLALGHRLNGAA